jgi:YHS domain-containing protein
MIKWRLKTDPVCGMQVDEERAADKVNHAGTTYFFCSRGCARRFRSNPERYLSGGMEPMPKTHEHGSQTSERHGISPRPADQATYTCPMHPEVRQAGPGSCPTCGMALERESPESEERVEYTCPMHPEVVSDKPGNCPTCGMALEPRTVTAEETNPELVDMSNRGGSPNSFAGGPLSISVMPPTTLYYIVNCSRSFDALLRCAWARADRRVCGALSWAKALQTGGGRVDLRLVWISKNNRKCCAGANGSAV